MTTLWFRLGRRIVLVLGSPLEVPNAHPQYTPRGELALYLDT